MVAIPDAQLSMSFLDMQASVGITKHIGGYAATDELISLCHIDQAHEVLNVGCGIGVEPAYIARKFNCHVVGVDISEKMIEWSRKRAREEGVEAKVELRTADVMELPFEANRFDAVLCESVLIFVDDQARAIRECVRVTKPGGYVGLNEAFWFKEPPAEMVARIKEAIGPASLTLEDWQTIWDASGLQERVIRPYRTDPRKELKDRIQWIGWRWLVRAWGRALRLYLANPAGRQAIKEMFDVPADIVELMGYALIAGKKLEA
jgi:ubiquinone/menaquinone biosynthesis C-methylase UbiE